MTYRVTAFLDGVGRHHTAKLYRVTPNAYGGGGSPPISVYSPRQPLFALTTAASCCTMDLCSAPIAKPKANGSEPTETVARGFAAQIAKRLTALRKVIDSKV